MSKPSSIIRFEVFLDDEGKGYVELENKEGKHSFPCGDGAEGLAIIGGAACNALAGILKKTGIEGREGG